MFIPNLNTITPEDAKVITDILSHPDNGPTPEARAWFAENGTGTEVHIRHTTGFTSAKVVDLNETEHGLYPGDRYPIFVEVVSQGDTNTFEYSIDQLEIVA